MSSYDVLILGGGFAGTVLARRLERRLPRHLRIGMVARENYITFSPLLPEVVGASILPGHVVAPLRQMISRTAFFMAEVTSVDLERRVVHYHGERPGEIGYRHLVLACGMTANLDTVPGMAEHALPLRSLGDALWLRNRVIERLEHAQLEPDPQRRRWLTTYAVVGGGFSGVEVAAEIQDFLRAAVRYYSAVEREDCRVVLAHGGARLLPEISPSLGEFARRKMTQRGIDVHLEARAASVDEGGIALRDGERIDASTVVSTVGATCHPLVAALDLPMERGRVRVEPDLSVPDRPGVWAVGDCAVVVNGYNGRPAPPTAQFATREARRLADNIARTLEGRSTLPFRYRPAGQLSSIGHSKAVAEIYGIRVSGFVAWLLWRGVYLLKIPTFARKVRIFLEWNWEMLFPPDTVNLRFTRTGVPSDEQSAGRRDSREGTHG